MKVMCIEQPDTWIIIAGLTGNKIPDVGDECTVKNTRRCRCGQHDVYDLEEFPSPLGFQTECFAVMPDVDAYDLNAAEQEAIVPNPFLEDPTPHTIEDKAIQAYMQVYRLTGCENRAADVYYEIINKPQP